MKNNIISTTVKKSFAVSLVEFYLPGGDGVYKLFVDPESLHLEAIQFWTDSIQESFLVSSQRKALCQFCEDIDLHIERNIPIPSQVWGVIKANQIRTLWFVDGLN
ncbi:MAG: hypothetical protein ACKPCP_32970 [Sphaerospermopsis kisseleviana]